MGVEVDKQTLPQIEKLHVGQYLRLVNRQQPVDALEFNQQNTLDNQIRSIAAVDARSFVMNWDFDLRFEIDACELELLNETIPVTRFQESRAETLMDLDRAADHLLDKWARPRQHS